MHFNWQSTRQMKLLQRDVLFQKRKERKKYIQCGYAYLDKT